MTHQIPEPQAKAAWTRANWPVPEWGWDALPEEEKAAWRQHANQPTTFTDTPDADFICPRCVRVLPPEQMGRCTHYEPRCVDCEADWDACPECVAEAREDHHAAAERRGA